ncbi:MAG: dihydrolipoamide acetyltransferase family protein [Flavobacteriaceae bacterium]|tara:strand:+ start:612 stop:1952 length:1341 start_codon:yes stop_codon:yes gene_type:complete
MAEYFLKLPKMGEGVEEATITNWLKHEGDNIEIDDSIVEIATDKVDSDIVSEVKGKLVSRKFEVNDVIKIGDVIAIIETKRLPEKYQFEDNLIDIELKDDNLSNKTNEEKIISEEIKLIKNSIDPIIEKSSKYYSPLVKNIAKKEGLTTSELEKIKGTGKDERITKNDIVSYLSLKKEKTVDNLKNSFINDNEENQIESIYNSNSLNFLEGKDQIIEMSRMEKILSSHMIDSLKKSAHVQSFIEVDVSDLWNWREKEKKYFLKRENQKLTFTTLFIYAIVKALRDYPLLNSSIDGEKIIIKNSINIGMATALSSGDLIVPVIKNADHMNLLGLTKSVNDLAYRARNDKLKPDEVKGGTYTITNIGNFGSIMGTPIINQPQVGILAIGVIRKMPSVVETNKGDFIAVRRKVILSHSYDHRIINGEVGGLFIKKVADYLENWQESLPK